MKKLTADRLHRVWIEDSPHENYIGGVEKSALLEMILSAQWGGIDNLKILEIGCNVGRNLDYLRQAGYENLAGVEISPRAAEGMQENFPELSEMVNYFEGPIEEIIRVFLDNQFDVVFSMAVLQHLHPDSEFVFQEIVRIARLGIITIEDETRHTVTMWPRDYGTVFTRGPMIQNFNTTCRDTVGLHPSYIARRFVKPESSIMGG